MAKERKIKIQMGEMTKPFRPFTVKTGTTLADFLASRNLSYSSSVRVNLKVAKKTSLLNEGDLITITDAVSGGNQ